MIGFILRRSPRYLGVSVACVLVNMLLLIGLDRLGWSSGAAVVASACLLIPLAFALHVHVTYTIEPTVPAFLRYAGVTLVNTPVAWLLLLLIHDRGGIDMVVAAPLVTLIMFFWNFLAGSWALLAGRDRPV